MGLEDFASSSQGAKGALSKGDSTHHQGFTYVQNTFRIQQQGHDEGDRKSVV